MKECSVCGWPQGHCLAWLLPELQHPVPEDVRQEKPREPVDVGWLEVSRPWPHVAVWVRLDPSRGSPVFVGEDTVFRLRMHQPQLPAIAVGNGRFLIGYWNVKAKRKEEA